MLHTLTRLSGMTPLTCALQKIGAAQPQRAPDCSTQACLRASITTEQAKLSVHSEYSIWQHPYKSPYRATSEESGGFETHFCSSVPQNSQGQPQTLPKGEAQTQCRRHKDPWRLGRTQSCSVHGQAQDSLPACAEKEKEGDIASLLLFHCPP